MKTLTTIALAVTLLAPSGAASADVQNSLKVLYTVGPDGAQSVEAREAWRELIEADASKLPEIIAGMDVAGRLEENWIGSAVDAIAERQLKRGGKLPVDELESFVKDTAHKPRARRLAYDWLVRVDPSAEERLIPGMLDDPCLELRRDAVAKLIERAENEKEPVALYQKAFAAARDIDQIKQLAKLLTDLGKKPDIALHMGFLLRWKVVGPFDNTDEKGFDIVYPPEKELDTNAEYAGKHGKVKWIDATSKDDYGLLDFNKILTEEKAVAAYAACTFKSDAERNVQIRITTWAAIKLWINGRLVDSRNVYHGGSQMDQYVSTATLKPGENVFLIKVCQNEQTQPWANKWEFRLRVCDEIGTAILSTDRK